MTTNDKSKGHTEEPWFCGPTPAWLVAGQSRDGKSRREEPITIRSGAHTEEIATVWTYLLPTAANAERIVACVNACAGLNPESVPELVKVLKAIAGWDPETMNISEARQLAELALAEAKVEA